MYENIPQEIKELNQWVCWKAETDHSRPGKIRKVPVNARTGGGAMSNNPDTWADYETAVSAAHNYNGIGFMFANGYFGVDIDGADDAIHDYQHGETGNIVSEFIHTLGSYAEYSVSGKGLHIICKGSLPPNGRRKGNVEMYESGRFFIMTGKSASEYMEIINATEAIKPLHEKYIGGGSEPIGRQQPQTATLSEREIIEAACNSKQGGMFSDLYNGNWEAYSASQSEADMSFCNMLAFWCACDEALMDSIFKTSGLMRDKWNRKQSGSTYGAITIDKAIKGCAKVYEPKSLYSITIGMPEAAEKVKLYSFDDTGNAERFIDVFGEDIRYSYINKAWFYYDGRRWLSDFTGAIKRMADDAIETIKKERKMFLETQPSDANLDEMGKVFDKHLKTCRSNKSKTAMLKESEHRVPILPENFDKQKHFLNTPNGIINLKTGELQAHDKKHYITKITHAEYTNKTDTPIWEQFLKDIFSNDTELIRFMQKAVGYSLSGSTKEDCIFFCYGTGRNGKSTFLNTMAEILGEYAINIQPETIMMKNNSGGPTSDIARLKGSRFVTVPEPSEGARLNEGLVKQMTGGDKMTASRKYENEFEFIPEYKLWMPTNHKPKVYGTDVGIWSRIRLIPFTVRIPDEKIDRNLKTKLKKEYAGILNWAVEGCLLWQQEGLIPPASVTEATAEYKTEMDVLASFLDECCVEGDGAVQSSDLFKVYLVWAKERNEYEMTSSKFGREMSKRFEKQRVAGGIYYHGVKVRDAYKTYAISFGE